MSCATIVEKEAKRFTATRNPCKLCMPLGASLAFLGVERCLPFLHGSQGCSTYIRRYVISHYGEPADIASSSFGESSAIFGGKANLFEGLDNVIAQYNPAMIGVATTCLVETIGEDVKMLVKEYLAKHGTLDTPPIVNVQTPSYAGTHAEGFRAAVAAMVSQLAGEERGGAELALFPGFVSPEDLRMLREICVSYGISTTLLPDYSQTLDGAPWREYQKLQEGGTPVEAIRKLGSARAALEFTSTGAPELGPCFTLETKFKIPAMSLDFPIGLKRTDAFLKFLENAFDVKRPKWLSLERGRLLDAYADGHKYVFGKRALVYGEEDFVVAMAGFLSEIGAVPAVCASGAASGRLAAKVLEATGGRGGIQIMSGSDFLEMEIAAKDAKIDFVIGSSKGYKTARALAVPLIRTGFPIHDRIGGGRILHLGYRGAMNLFDLIANTLIQVKQDSSSIGYSYM